MEDYKERFMERHKQIYRIPDDKMQSCQCDNNLSNACAQLTVRNINPWSGRRVYPNGRRYRELLRYCRIAHGDNVPGRERSTGPPKKKSKRTTTSEEVPEAVEVVNPSEEEAMLALNRPTEIPTLNTQVAMSETVNEMINQIDDSIVNMILYNKMMMVLYDKLQKHIRTKYDLLTNELSAELWNRINDVEVDIETVRNALVENQKQLDVGRVEATELAAIANGVKSGAVPPEQQTETTKLSRALEDIGREVQTYSMFERYERTVQGNTFVFETHYKPNINQPVGLFSKQKITKGTTFCIDDSMQKVPKKEFQTYTRTGNAIKINSKFVLDSTENFGESMNHYTVKTFRANSNARFELKNENVHWIATKDIEAEDEIFLYIDPKQQPPIIPDPVLFRNLPFCNDNSCHIDSFLAGVLACICLSPDQFPTINEWGTGSFDKNGDLNKQIKDVYHNIIRISTDLLRILCNPTINSNVVTRAVTSFRRGLKKEQAAEHGSIEEWSNIFKHLFTLSKIISGMCEKHGLQLKTVSSRNIISPVNKPNPTIALMNMINKVHKAPCSKQNPNEPKCDIEMNDIKNIWLSLPPIIQIQIESENFTANEREKHFTNIDFTTPGGKITIQYTLAALFNLNSHKKHWTVYFKYKKSWYLYDDLEKAERVSKISEGDKMTGTSAFFVRMNS